VNKAGKITGIQFLFNKVGSDPFKCHLEFGLYLDILEGICPWVRFYIDFQSFPGFWPGWGITH